jgi:hypothetical protein
MASNFIARDKSITSLTGASQLAVAANANRVFLEIENTGTANIGVNYCGGTAAIGGTGTFTLWPGGSTRYEYRCPQNAVYLIGTAGETVSITEG